MPTYDNGDLFVVGTGSFSTCEELRISIRDDVAVEFSHSRVDIKLTRVGQPLISSHMPQEGKNVSACQMVA